jgi:hypothetical protein
MQPLAVFIRQGHHVGFDVIRLPQWHQAIKPEARCLLFWVSEHPRLNNLSRSNASDTLPRVFVHDRVLDTLSSNRGIKEQFKERCPIIKLLPPVRVLVQM